MRKIETADIKNIARRAGQEILRYYGKPYDISRKADSSPVTEADLASEELIKTGLGKYGLPILSEESADDAERSDAEYVWIVDPLDGTSDFIQGTDEFSVLIGLLKNKVPIFGVVYEPMKDRTCWAEKGKGAFVEVDGRTAKMRVSNIDEFSQATILLSRNHLLESETEFCRKAGIKKRTGMGSAGLKMCRLAEGRAEIYLNFSDRISEWDTCAGTVIVEEAGGIVTDMAGKKLAYNKPKPNHPRGIIASNKAIRPKIKEAIK